MTMKEIRERQRGLRLALIKKIKEEQNPQTKKEMLEVKGILDFVLDDDKSAKAINSPSFKGLSKAAKAIGIVQVNTAAAASIAGIMAQTPGADEAALIANDLAMVISIGKIYGMNNFDKSAIGTLAMLSGKGIGVRVFAKAVTWFPGAGNVVNATVAAGVTEAIGLTLVGFCELAYRKGEKPDLKNFDPSKRKEYKEAAKKIER